MSKNTAHIAAVIGASGSGKSTFIKQTIRRAKPARLLLWDPQGEYAEFGTPVRTLAELHAALTAAGARGKFALVFIPSGDPKAMVKQFDMFCLLAYHAGNLTLICEELADVTQAGFAPSGWSIATRKGRHNGLRIYGASQRPASIDKHFFGNATVIRTGRLNFAADIKVMANVLQVPEEDIRALLPLEWVERDMQNGKITRGKITF